MKFKEGDIVFCEGAYSFCPCLGMIVSIGRTYYCVDIIDTKDKEYNPDYMLSQDWGFGDDKMLELVEAGE